MFGFFSKIKKKTDELWLFLAFFEVFGLTSKIKKPEEIWLFVAFFWIFSEQYCMNFLVKVF